MNTLFEVEEKESGIKHYIIAKHDSSAYALASHHASKLTGFEREFYSEDFKINELNKDDEYTFFSESDPITHTVKQWEMIYSDINSSRFYLACSEY